RGAVAECRGRGGVRAASEEGGGGAGRAERHDAEAGGGAQEVGDAPGLPLLDLLLRDDRDGRADLLLVLRDRGRGHHDGLGGRREVRGEEPCSDEEKQEGRRSGDETASWRIRDQPGRSIEDRGRHSNLPFDRTDLANGRDGVPRSGNSKARRSRVAPSEKRVVRQV